MELFYQYNKIYKDFKAHIQNVQLMDLYQDIYEIEQKPKKIKYFKQPKNTKYPLNLNEGYEGYRCRNIDVLYGNNLSKVIRYDIEKNISSISNENNTINIFTHRFAILNIIKSHFYKNGSHFFDWNLFVTKSGKNLYMYSENDTQQVAASEAQFYHSKLEQMLFSDSPYTEPKTNVPVDENIRLNGIYQCQLGNFNLIYTAEIQGVISDTEIKDITNMDSLSECRFVNTKMMTKGKGFVIKEIQRYFHNYLANVDVTYLAVRDADGYVHEPIKEVKTEDMRKSKYWNPREYEQFLYDFLSSIVDKMAHVNSLVTTYEFNYRSINKAVYYKVHEGKTTKSFLAEDYIKFMERRE